MVSEGIKKLRDEFKKETTLSHIKQGVGHTQYYSEWLEIKLDNQQQEIENLNKKLLKTSFVMVDQKQEIERLKGDQWISVKDANILEHMNYLCRYNDCRPFVAQYKDGNFMDLDQMLAVTHICIIPPRKE